MACESAADRGDAKYFTCPLNSPIGDGDCVGVDGTNLPLALYLHSPQRAEKDFPK
jgi:hypothetical protein